MLTEFQANLQSVIKCPLNKSRAGFARRRCAAAHACAGQRRAQQLKAAREALFIELAGVRRDTSLPAVEYLNASQVDVFGKVLREKLLASCSSLAKSYLNILVDEIVVQDKTATIRGSYAALAETMQKIKMGNLNQVPTFNPDWRA